MIHSVTNPKMNNNEIKEFRCNFVRHVSKELTREETITVSNRLVRAKKNYKKIINNNGGKNPILRY